MRATRRRGLADLVFDESEAAADELARLPRGAFDVEVMDDGRRTFWFKCPGNCGQVAPLHLRPDGAAQQSWEWDGNEEEPTLSPSIHHPGCWHGWLSTGQFVPA